MEPWRSAWDRANQRFYTSSTPRRHFRTSTEYADILGRALLEIVPKPTDDRPVQIVDVGGGDGRLLAAIKAAWEVAGQDPALLECTLIDLRGDGADDGIRTVVAPAPECLPSAFPHGVHGLLLAHEWLDDIACDVIEVDASGVIRLVLVDSDTGHETLGPALSDPAAHREFAVDPRSAEWVARWWPIRAQGARAEIGLSRDDAWAACAAAVHTGVAVMIDYTHSLTHRPPAGSLAAYRNGRRMRAVPDGTSNITAHVAVDALASASHSGTTRLRTQREVLARTPRATDELLRLQQESRLATLRDPGGLGSFTWLEQQVVAASACRATMSA